MGIKDLARVIADYAPHAVQEKPMSSYFGRIVAVDASMSIYQFLIAVRQDGSQLTSDAGDATSHLLGMFYRTIRMIANGIKPVYVFDGKPPVLKTDELEKRQGRRSEAAIKYTEAFEKGDTAAVDKFSRRLVRVTGEQNEECKRLLRLMGVPFLDAPCEAEAQCAALVKARKVYASATEDMDTLTFGSDVLLRHMTFSEAKKMPIKEFHLEAVLKGLELNNEEFVDLCILLGCDYCQSIRGIGVKRSVELIKKYRSLDEVLKHIDKSKYQVPENWPYKAVRKLFLEPEVADCADLQLSWSEPDEEGLVEFLAREKNFSEDRVRGGASKLRNARKTCTQTRIDTFFKFGDSSAAKRPNKPAQKPPPAKKNKTVKVKKS